jgi:hypothetical protein
MNTWKERASLMARADGIGLIRRSHSSITLDHARTTRAKVWLYVFDCYETNKEGARPDAPNDGTTKAKEGDSANGNSIQ